jgi:hypothetical protein
VIRAQQHRAARSRSTLSPGDRSQQIPTRSLHQHRAAKS